MDYRINVFWRATSPQGPAILDGRAAALLIQIAQLGIDRVKRVQVSDLYFVRGALTPADLDRLASELLADPVIEGYDCQPVMQPDASPAKQHKQPESVRVVEVGFHPGVTEPVAWHLLRRAQLL
ncbi:MAG: hypothetical protein JW934_14765, partial [Anaerolineae bacterium]|nr:hypothetical protein [Anaerolineae bacterium]